MIDFKKWAHHPRQTKCSEEADQLEWRTYQAGPSPVDAPQLDDEITGSIDEVQRDGENDDSFDSPPSTAVGDAINNNLRVSSAARLRSERRSEDLNAGTLAEVERRIALLGDHYPFALEGGSLRSRGTSSPAHAIYLDCLRTSIKPTNRDREDFEQMVVKALGSYLGGGSQSQLFGWQTWTESERPRRIKAMVEEIQAKTSEWPWCPEVDLPDDPPSTLIKDMGMDAIAWLPMPDSRWGRVMLIAQCATGKTDWEDKLSDVDWNKIEDWIRPMPNRWTIRCFAVPFHLPNEVKWRKVSKIGGLFLDRARLTLLLKELPPTAGLQPQRVEEALHSQSPETAPQSSVH